MKQRLVVVGSNGFLGSTFCNLIDKNIFELQKITSQDCDLEKDNSILYLKNNIRDKDIVVFSAAKAPAKDWNMMGNNIVMVNNFVKGLENINIDYLLNISSDAVYSDSDKEIDENYETMPNNPHGLMHYIREKIINENLKIPVGHLRPTLVYGKNDPHNGYGPNKFLRLAKEKKDIELFGKGEELRDHINVEDVAIIAISMIKNNFRGNINAVTANPMTFNEIAQTVRSVINEDIKVINNPRKGPMPHNGLRIFKKSRIIEILPNFKPNKFINYLKETLDV